MSSPTENVDNANDVAIIGMAGRFPGAPDVDAFWTRVEAGDDCLTDLDADHLVRAGVPTALVNSSTYVRRAGLIADVAGFDPGFFGIGHRDGSIMDPQHRHFLECAWAALESSGTVPERFDGAIGVFGGCGMNTYLINNLLTNPTVLPQLGWFLLRHTGNDKDFLTNNVAYRLDLRGPAVNVQTACSTSLVAVHLATQSLLSFECDLALAGGATIQFPHDQGYEYQEGEVLSPDGYCRAFDVESAGTVITNGAALIALRRLDDALAAGDPILAVIKGTAINNDGARKVGFLAPSVDGHADVVRDALTVAGLSARDIQLLEAHGTGTAVGDPIEVAALTEAFRASTTDTGFCRLVSTKPNIGHLDTAAGTASVIKVVQAMEHRTLPPLANHTAPSPLLDLEHSPFHLSAASAPWPDSATRRAGVSSLGVGGTNAHIVLEEAPRRAPTEPGRAEQVIVLSARTAEALADASGNLADHLEANPDVSLADVAHTLAVGRREMASRLAVTATDTTTAVSLLRSTDRYRRHVGGSSSDGEPVRLGFMFPGGGSQYPGMGAELDDRFSVFHTARRDNVALVRELGGPDLEPLLASDGDAQALRRPTAALPAVFATSIALARQWLAFGSRPDFFLGHSLGEYVAAHLAGVLSIEDATALVVTRSRLIESVGGDSVAMLAVPLAESDVLELLPPSLSLAAINATDECVVSGPVDDIHAFAGLLEQRDAAGTLIPLAAAGHSSLLDPVLSEFLDAVRQVDLHRPTIPYPSNLTGAWITAEQATDPQYWVDHLRHTVRFSDCLSTALGSSSAVLTELGPGQALSSYARRSRPAPVATIPALRHPDHEIADTAYALHAYARQWVAGVPVDLRALTGGERRRLRLPTYPFQHEHCWIEPGTQRVITDEPSAPAMPLAPAMPRRISDLDRAYWIPTWESAPPAERVSAVGSWLIVADAGHELAGEVVAELERRGGNVNLLTPAGGISADLSVDGLTGVVVLAPTGAPPGDFERSMTRWLADAPAIVTQVARSATRTELVAVTRGALAVTGLATRPSDALALGVVTVAPREYPGLRTRLIDADPTGTRIDRLVDDILGGGDRVIAHRGDLRVAQARLRAEIQSKPLATRGFRDNGTYLVTGALGGVGHVLATHLATTYHANLVIVTSDAIPEPAERERWLDRHAFDDPTARRIRQLRVLESIGTKVTAVHADVSDPGSLRAALDRIERDIGRLDGAVHAAGRIRDQLLEFATVADHEYVVGPKARAALVLADELRRRGAELLVLVSSTSTLLAPEGQTGYVAANAVLDELAGTHGTLRVATMNFGLWADVGVASETARRARLGIEAGEPTDHPVLSEMHRAGDGTVRLVGRLEARQQWVVDEHRTSDGHALLPGTGHLELMLAGARLAGYRDADLTSVALLRPLPVGEDTPTAVRVTVSPGPAVSIQVESDGGRGKRWTLHSEAVLDIDPSIPDIDEDVELTAGGAAVAIDLLARSRRNLTLGPRWDAVEEAWLEGDTAVARLALRSEFADEAAQWRAHPALLDVATAAGIALGATADERAIYVPVGYERVRVPGPLPPAMTVRAREVRGSRHDLLRVDLLGVADGRTVLRIDGLDLLPVLDQGHLGEVDDDDRDIAAPAATLVELADELGLRPAEGVAMLDRLVGGEHPRLIGSTIDLDDLLARVDVEPVDASTAPTGAITTSSTVEGALQVMWRELLGLDDVGTEDDFFEIGGHSLIAIRLMARIQRELDVRLQLASIFEDSTIVKLAAQVREARPDIELHLAAHDEVAATPDPHPPVRAASARTMVRHLVPITTTGHKRPLHIVHGAGGSVLFLWNMAGKMAGDRPIYAFQADGVDGNEDAHLTIEAMAARYVAELREQRSGPYYLGGYSAGGVIALEMVNQLRAVGEQVDYVLLFDSTPGGKSFPSGWERRKQLATYILRGGLRPVWPYLRFVLGNRLGHRFPSLIVEQHPETAQQQDELDFMDNVDDVFWHVSARAAEHDLGVVDADAVLLKAAHNWPGLPDDYYWRPHIGRQLDIRVVPGEHHSMFYPQNVGRLAEIVREVLDQRDRRAGAA